MLTMTLDRGKLSTSQCSRFMSRERTGTNLTVGWRILEPVWMWLWKSYCVCQEMNCSYRIYSLVF